MADNKKYYYMKLKDNFFDSEEMIVLESMTDGYLYSNILLKLYLRSLKDDGCLMFKGIIPYTPEVLAKVTRHNHGVVEKAIQIFKQLGLVEILDNGAIYMLDIQNFIGESSTEADRKRLYRSKIENEMVKLGQMSGQMSDESPDNSPPEIEIEIEIEKERKDNTFSAYTSNPEFLLTLNSFEDFRKKIKKPMTDRAKKMLVEKLDKLATTDEEKITILNESIFNGWQGVFELKERKTDGLPKGPKPQVARQEPNYVMREFTQEELEALPRG